MDQNGSKWSEWTELDTNGHNRTEWEGGGLKWTEKDRVDQCGPNKNEWTD